MENSIEELKRKRDQFVKEYHELESQLSDLGIKNAQIRNRPKTINDEQANLRSVWVKRHSKLQSEIYKINTKIKESYATNTNMEYDALKKILKEEVLGERRYIELMREKDSRLSGNIPCKLTFSLIKSSREDVDSANTKKRLRYYHELLLAARKTINAYINSNEPDINKADFLKSVSGINKCLPPLAEIERDKSIYNI